MNWWRVVGRMLITLSDEVEEKFRKTVAKVYGARKGALSKAVEEAIKMWLEKHGEKV